MGVGRTWAAMQFQRRPQLTPEGVPELEWPFRVGGLKLELGNQVFTAYGDQSLDATAAGRRHDLGDIVFFSRSNLQRGLTSVGPLLAALPAAGNKSFILEGGLRGSSQSTTVYLHILICKMGIIIVPTSPVQASVQGIVVMEP